MLLYKPKNLPKCPHISNWKTGEFAKTNEKKKKKSLLGDGIEPSSPLIINVLSLDVESMRFRECSTTALSELGLKLSSFHIFEYLS
jgi:hypothetical protein